MADIRFPTETPNVTPIGSDRLLLSQTSASNAIGDCAVSSLPISTATQSALDAKQATLVSGTNIKTINSVSLLGAWDIVLAGTVSSVTSANADATVATTTTTPVITIVSAPKLTTARTIGGTSFDGTANIGVALATTVTTNANLTGVVTSTGNATAIANGVITNAMLANAAVANLMGTNTGDQTNISGNAATVTTNANLTGVVTSVGNATAIADTALSIAKTSGLQTALDAKAPLASPALTGTPTAPTAAAATNTTQIATTAFVLANAWAGLAWNATTSGSTGTGLGLTMNNSYAASGIGQDITMGNTQTNAVTGLKIDTWTSSVAHTGILVNAKGANSSQSGISVALWSTGSGRGVIVEQTTLGGFLGSLLNISHQAIWTLTARLSSGSTNKIGDVRYHTWATTVTETANTLFIDRQSITDNASANLTENGTVLWIRNTSTATTGTLTDNVTALKVEQSALSTKEALHLSTAGTAKTSIKFDSGFTSATAPTWASTYILIDIGGVTYKLLAQAS